ncbi:Manganese-binding lipoprotein MntA [bacterium HR37]|nr:Manganese-binding lipoprotein MntA [bacterium HR37]
MYKERVFKRILRGFSLVVLFVFVSCLSDMGREGVKGNKKIALATVNIIGDMVAQVAGERVEVISLLPIGGDPHTYEPVPGDLKKIAESDIVFFNGLGLEKWLEKLLKNAGGTRPYVAVTDGLEPIRDERGDPDPHLWMDVTKAMGYVRNIRDALVEFDPEGEQVYRENAAGYLLELEKLDKWIFEQVETIPPQRRKLVTTHDAFRYFGQRYGFKVVGTIWGISTEDEPSAQEIAQLIDAIRRERVPAVFIETTVNPKLMERVAREAGVKVGRKLYGDSLGPPGSGADTYIGMMRSNVLSIVQALGGVEDVGKK